MPVPFISRVLSIEYTFPILPLHGMPWRLEGEEWNETDWMSACTFNHSKFRTHWKVYDNYTLETRCLTKWLSKCTNSCQWGNRQIQFEQHRQKIQTNFINFFLLFYLISPLFLFNPLKPFQRPILFFGIEYNFASNFGLLIRLNTTWKGL